MEIIDGKIVDYDGRVLTIKADYTNYDRFCLSKPDDCRIALTDSRAISNEQRRKAYALLNEIADYMGEMPEYAKRLFKLKFIHDTMREMADDIFSLSDCDMTTAREFITYLVDFIIAHDIPTGVPLRDLCEDIQKYVWACAMNKKCVICGKHAELHHCDRLGMGADRTQPIHEGLKAMPLCREHHTECHTVSQSEFNERYHLESIVIDKKICKTYGLKYKME